MTINRKRIFLLTAALLAMWPMVSIAYSAAPEDDEPAATPALTGEQVVANMVEMNKRRAEALQSYTSTREYHLELHGTLNKRADVVARMTYHSPDRKEFQIVSATGSKFLRDSVLKRLIKAEEEATQKENRERTDINPANYDFSLEGVERTPQRQFYVLMAAPKVENKFLFKGKIWVDAQDYAIARIEGEPAKNPSWWTLRNDFQHSYKKVGDFWLPARNETVTRVRIFGRSLLTIEYKDYELTEAHSFQPLDDKTALLANSRIGQ